MMPYLNVCSHVSGWCKLCELYAHQWQGQNTITRYYLVNGLISVERQTWKSYSAKSTSSVQFYESANSYGIQLHEYKYYYVAPGNKATSPPTGRSKGRSSTPKLAFFRDKSQKIFVVCCATRFYGAIHDSYRCCLYTEACSVQASCSTRVILQYLL
jgi:hypothetical protein